MTATADPTPAPARAPSSFKRWRMITVTRTELRQLFQAKDFWAPMVALGAFFFVVVPAFVLTIITSLGEVGAVQQLSQTLDLLPQAAQDAVPQDASPSAQVGYVAAV